MNTLRILKNSTIILRLLILFLLLGSAVFPFPAKGMPQFFQNASEKRIALKLDRADASGLASEQLRAAREVGIDLLEVSFPTGIDPTYLEDFYFLLDTSESFRTVNEINSSQKAIVNSIQLNLNNVPNRLQDNIAAVKLFNFPADYEKKFPPAARNILSQLSVSVDKPFYYQSAFPQPAYIGKDFDFISSRITTADALSSSGQTPVILFEPSDDVTESLQALEQILNRSINQSESLIIIPAGWFFARMEAQNGFPQIISFYLHGNGDAVSFPMPEDEPVYPHANWPVIFLLAIWGSFIVRYKNQPIYKSTLPRYFFNHSFFVYDIMEHRIRSISPGITVLIQHTFLTGLFFYLLGEAFITDTGLQVLSRHFPILFFTGLEKLSLFLIGMIVALLSHTVSVAWIFLLNGQLKQIYQAINLYSWPLHVNLIVITLVVYFVQLNSAYNWLIIAASAYFLVWFCSFTIAAIDGARFLDKFRTLNLLLTVGIHFLLIITVIILIIFLPFIFEPLEMSLRLP